MSELKCLAINPESQKGESNVAVKKWKKLIISAALIILAICAVTYISNPERRVKNFVNHNSEELKLIAEAYLNSDTTIKTYKGVEIEQVFRGTHHIVQFYYSGIGIIPASKYYGFYYSPDDIPTAYQNVKQSLTAVSDKEWKWSDGTDNGGRTIKITKNWFYYEAWF
jgi:hypothetical protein